MGDYNPFDISEQEAATADKAVKGKIAQENEAADIKWLMSSKRGRRIVWRLLSQAEVFQPVFHPTAMMMAWKEGNRNFGLRLFGLVSEHCSDLYPVMLKENTNGRSNPDGASHQSQ